MFLIYLEEVLLFWTAYNLMRSEVIAKNALLVFIFSCGLMALLLRSGYLESTSDLGARYSGRLSGMGQNPNSLAANLALGILSVVGLTYGTNKRILKFRSLYLVLIPLMGVCLINTTSRGGFMALGVGLLAFVLKRGDARLKIKSLTAVLILLLFFVWGSYYSGSMWNRYQKTIEDGNMAEREEIFPDAWEMFLEKPLIGWGPVNNNYELATRTAEEGRENLQRDTHNLWLEVLTATGLVGAIPFFAGVWICSRAAWKARAMTFGALPVVLMITMFVLNASMNWIQSKQAWLVFAFALASSNALPGNVNQARGAAGSIQPG
jgi:O-antigen ligase